MRVVLDTNVLISALLWPRGTPAHVFALARQGRIHSVTSAVLLEEFQRVLEEKFEFPSEFLGEMMELMVEHSEIVSPALRIQAVREDPEDNRVLECAVEGAADAIVTGDWHLLKLRVFRNIPIVNPRQFLIRFFSA